MHRPSRPTFAEIHLPALASNLQAIQHHVSPGTIVMAVVKANAYGHGMLPVASYLEKHGAKYFGVAFAEEGAALRAAGVRLPIHVFAISVGEQAALCVRHRLEPTLASLDSVEAIRRAAERSRRTVDVHIKVETGMNRIGVRPDGLTPFLRALGKSRRLRVKGVYTHFATADVPGSAFVGIQLKRFHEFLEKVRQAGIEPELVHAANSGAILFRADAEFSMVRAGILTYGYSPSFRENLSLRVRPAMSLRTSVVQVKRIKAGESVSYGRRFRSRSGTTIATLPIGYGDGLFRSLTSKASVLLHGVHRPIVGTICMDQCMADCGTLDISTGDDVVVIGRQRTSTITAWDVARQAGTIPYEITCAVSARVPRVYMS